MKWCSRAVLALGVLALALGTATAAGAQQFDIHVTVCQLGEGPGGIDKKCAKLHARAQNQLRYESLTHLKTGRLKLGLDEVGTLKLPNGQPLRVRPLDLTDQGLLLAAEVGGLKADLKVAKGRLVVMDGGRHEGQKVAVSFEPRW